jgi:hypothetical protein
LIATGDFIEARGRHWLVDAVIEGAPTRHRLVCIDDDAQGEAAEMCLDAELSVRRPTDDAWGHLGAATPADPRALGAHLRGTEWATA